MFALQEALANGARRPCSIHGSINILSSTRQIIKEEEDDDIQFLKECPSKKSRRMKIKIEARDDEMDDLAQSRTIIRYALLIMTLWMI